MDWLSNIFLRKRRYDDLAVSIKEHLEEKIEELMEDGMSRREAERTARREFGNVTLTEERSREIWQCLPLESLWADTKFAFRQLLKSPGFTTTAVLTLALGIAVNATIFSLVSAFLLAHVPGTDPQHVVVVSSVNPNQTDQADINPVSAPNYLAWRKESRVFADMAAVDEFRTASMAGQGQPEVIHYAAASPNYFNLLGVSPQFGRLFAEGEDRPGRSHVVILDHALWQGRFASDPSVIGKTIRLNRESYVVIGVMPEDFRLLGFTPQLWTPLVVSTADETPSARANRFLYLFARLSPGMTLREARAQLTVLAHRAEAASPVIERHWGAAARPLPDFLVYSFGIGSALAILMTTVSFVLLIACANVAGLLLTRAAHRQKELAIRLSIGAGRARIVRQLVTEGLVIGLLGAGVGLLLTWFAIGLVRANLNFNEEISAVPLSLDTNVLLFLLAISLLSAVLSSLAPALRSVRTSVNTDLKSESRTASAGRSRSLLRTGLVSAEIALALFLLTGTALLIRGVFLLDHQSLGFRTDHLLTAGLELDQTQYQDQAQQLRFVSALLPRLQQIPGVEGVAVTSDLPATNPATVPILIQGEAEKLANEKRTALNAIVTSDYFNIMSIPLLRGRAFTEADNATSPRVVLVNREFVRRFLPDKNPLGIQVRLDITGAVQHWNQIVGVVADVKSFSEYTRVDPEVYECFPQRPVPSLSLLLLSKGEPEASIPALRKEVAKLDVELPLARVRSLHEVIVRQSNGNPLFTNLLGAFALLALILAAIGIYGLIAYSVGQRSHEIGIRMALGAKSPDILRLILHEGLKTTAIGSTIGLALALPLAKLFDAMFQGMHFAAPILNGLAAAAILLVAALATSIPAIRATHIDPTAAFRDQ